jgi:succinoglycan biosynthesis transport protein ExoP
MNLLEFFQIVRKNLFYLLFFPALLAIFVFLLIKDKPLEYKTYTLLYTGVVSGYNLNTAEGNKTDYNSITNSFDNLTSIVYLRDVAEETSLRLLALNLMDNPEIPHYEERAHLEAKKLINPDLAKRLVDNSSYEKTVSNVIFYYKNGPHRNQIVNLLGSQNPFYGITSIQRNSGAYRKSSSDIIEISYGSLQQHICYQTIQILSETVIKRYKEIKTMETANVVKYFEEKARVAKDSLEVSEQKLVEFGVKNKIINFDQQTRAMASSKESVLENIEKEKMILSSSQASLNSLNKKLNMRSGLMESNNNVMVKRQKLADLNYKISNAEINGQTGTDLAKKKEEAEVLRNEIKDAVNDIYQRSNSQEGIQGSVLLGQWLNYVLAIDESNARLGILNRRLREFDSTYDQFAPMGSQLASLQREVAIAEKAYLEVLHALNQSNMKQQNIAYSSNLKIIEPPPYPGSANALKNKMLVLASFVCGFILILAFFVTRELLDDSIKNPGRAQNYTKLSLGGNFSFVGNKKSLIDMDRLESNLMEQTLSTVLLNIGKEGAHGFSKRIIVSSLRQGEGKTWCAVRMANKLSNRNSVLLVTPKSGIDGENQFIDPAVTVIEYDPKNSFMQMNDLYTLPNVGKAKIEKFQYVIIEIPPLTESQVPIELIKEADLSLLVLSAQRKWKFIDSSVIELFKKASSKEALILLNKVSTDVLESILGEIPKFKKGSEGYKFGKNNNKETVVNNRIQEKPEANRV